MYEKVNRAHANELRNGFSNGFKLGYTGPRELRMSKNLVSANDNGSEVHKNIRAEIEKGRVGGPYDSPPIPRASNDPFPGA